MLATLFSAFFKEIYMDLLKEKVKPLYLKLLATAAGSSFVSCIFAIIDSMVVGKYHGPNGTAALAIFNPVWAFVFSLGLLIGIGGSVLFANNRGKGEIKKSNEYFTLSIIFSAVLSIIAFTILTLFNKPLFYFFGADDNLLKLVQDYFFYVKFALPCCIFNNVLASFIRNDGNPTLASLAIIIGGIFNAFGDYFFVFTCDMGARGAGLATAIGLYLSFFIMLIHFFLKRNTLRLVKPTSIFHKISRVSIYGFPTAINDFAMGIIAILFNRQIMTYLNSDALAVYGIITQVTAFVQCCAYGAGQASQPIMSQNLGAQQPTRIKECLKYGIITAIIFGVCWTLLIQVFPNLFVHLFMSPTDSVLAVAPTILRIYGISYLITPFNIFATYYFQAILKSKVSTLSSIARGLVLSGLFIMILPVLCGADSLWFAMVITESIIALISIFYIHKYTKAL